MPDKSLLLSINVIVTTAITSSSSYLGISAGTDYYGGEYISIINLAPATGNDDSNTMVIGGAFGGGGEGGGGAGQENTSFSAGVGFQKSHMEDF